MKRKAFVILTTLSLLAMPTATSVYAQSGMYLKVNITFQFSVREKVLPAGEYIVWNGAHGVLVIQSADRRESQFFQTLSTQAGTKRHESSLVFNRYGDQYFLSTIWTAGDDTGYQLNKLHAEEELIRARRLVAGNASDGQTVSIVAHR
jgi:hypothetical protein